MAKFNTKASVPRRPRSPLVAEQTPSAVTYEGGPGYLRDAKAELFLLGVNNMVEDTFYEQLADRNGRFARLCGSVAVSDPQWITEFLGWLRLGGNLRTAPVIGAAHAGAAMLRDEVPGARKLFDVVCQRADEPGVLLKFWMDTYGGPDGRRIPMPLKKGLAQAVTRLWTPYTIFRYDTENVALRFADILALIHRKPDDVALDGPLTKWIMFRAGRSRGHKDQHVIDETLIPMAAQRADLLARAATDVTALFYTPMLRLAGMTHEDVMSLAPKLDPDVSRKELLGALWGVMGYDGLLKNLRAFDEVGLEESHKRKIAERLADPERIAQARLLPFKVLAAYEQARSLTWGPGLEAALTASTANIPALPGRTLVLVDTSASMTKHFLSANSQMSAMKAAAVFGVALAAKGDADLFGWADGISPFQHGVPKGASVLREITAFFNRVGEDGHGTNMHAAIANTFRPGVHKRVVILSDMQTVGGGHRGVHPGQVLPDGVPLYGFNLSGHSATAVPFGRSNWYEMGGLTDATFAMIPALEAGGTARWPWESGKVTR